MQERQRNYALQGVEPRGEIFSVSSEPQCGQIKVCAFSIPAQLAAATAGGAIPKARSFRAPLR